MSYNQHAAPLTFVLRQEPGWASGDGEGEILCLGKTEGKGGNRTPGRKGDVKRFRRAAKKIRTGARARSRARELVVGTYNVRTLAFKKHEKKWNHRVGLTVRESIVAGMDKGDVAVECISARLMKVRIQLKRKSNGLSFIVGYAPTLDKSTSEKHYFWSSRDEVVKGVHNRGYLLVLMDANARKGMRGIGRTDSKVLGAYERDELNDNGERLLIHANKLALLNAYYDLPVVYRTRSRVQTEEKPSTGLATY